MNLVDAIRMASQANQPNPNAPAPAPVARPNAVTSTPYEAPAATVTPEAPPVVAEDATPVFELTTHEEVAVAESHIPAHMVRIELFLTAEQSQQLLKNALGSQRAVLNSREVAQLLRTTCSNVERLASEGKLPAFRLDESWRFSKAALEEWMSHQGREGEEGVRHVA